MIRTLEGVIVPTDVATPRPDKVLYWSPNGRLLAACSEMSIRIVDPETGLTAAWTAERVESLAWSPDGSRIDIALNQAPVVRIWHLGAGQPPQPGWKASAVTRALFWDPSGRRLTGFGADGSRTTWDPRTGRVLEERAIVPDLEAVERDDGGRFLVMSGTGGLSRVVDAASGTETAALFHHFSAVRAMAVSIDGSRLYVGGLGMPGLQVFDPRWDPAGRVVAAQVQLSAMTFDERGEILRTINWERDKDGASIATHDADGASPRRGPRLPVSNRIRFPRADFAFTPDGRRLAAPRNGNASAVGIWDVITGREVATVRAASTVISLAFDAGGARLATGLWDNRRERGEVLVWDLATGRAVRAIDAGPRTVQVVALSPDGRTVAAGGYDGQPNDPGWARAWDVATGHPRISLEHAGFIMALAFHPDGTRLAAGDLLHDKLHLWDLTRGTEVQGPAPEHVCCMAFTPDGTRLAAVGVDGQVHLADARTGEQLLVLRSAARPAGNAGFTPRLAFSRDGSRLAANGVHDLSFWELRARDGPDPPLRPADVTGWLRQGRALAGQGDAAGAEAAFARAREADDGDPSPWIEHAVLLWRGGDSSQARAALDRAIGSLPDDPGRWSDLGQLLARFGRTKESETAMAKARTLLERRLRRATDDEAAAAALAAVLPDPGASRGWTILQPDVLTSAGGATLTRQPDGSVLAGGPNPNFDSYTVEAVTTLTGITGLRLGALPDPSLPYHGPGRYPDNGNFHLDAIRLSAVLEPRAAAPYRVPLIRARADYADYAELRELGVRGVIGALDEDPMSSWGIWPRAGQTHQAVFQTAEPLETRTGTRLRVELSFHSRWPHHSLGRFRLSVTDRPFPFFELSLLGTRADNRRNGRTRLGAAYAQLGDWAPAAAVLARAAARPDATALDGLLLALAHNHLGRVNEARSDCDRALEQPGSDLGDEQTHDVAVAALMTIRGLALEEAEALLLDWVFPADPFAR